MKTIVHQPRQMEQSQKDVFNALLSTYVLNRKMKMQGYGGFLERGGRVKNAKVN